MCSFGSEAGRSRRAGDHVVIRLTGPAITVAGGTVIDPDPPRVRRAAPEPAARARAGAGARATVGRGSRGALRAPRGVAAHAARRSAPPTSGRSRSSIAAGRAVRAGRDLAFTADALASAQAAVVDLAGETGSVTLAQLRDRLGVSRKFAQGLLEALDARGVTRRVGDERILRRRSRRSGTDGRMLQVSPR